MYLQTFIIHTHTHTHMHVCTYLYILLFVTHRVVYFVAFQSQSHVQLFETFTMACQALLFMRFLRQGYQSGLPSPSLGDLTKLGIKPASSALAGRFFTTERAHTHTLCVIKCPINVIKCPINRTLTPSQSQLQLSSALDVYSDKSNKVNLEKCSCTT